MSNISLSVPCANGIYCQREAFEPSLDGQLDFMFRGGEISLGIYLPEDTLIRASGAGDLLLRAAGHVADPVKHIAPGRGPGHEHLSLRMCKLTAAGGRYEEWE